MRENLGVKIFAQALISGSLEIICKVLREYLYPRVEGGGYRSVVSGQ